MDKYKMKTPILLLFILLSTKINSETLKQATDSLKVEKMISTNSIDSLFKLIQLERDQISQLADTVSSKSNSSSTPIMGYVLTFIGVLITASVAYKVGTNQGKTNLKIKKIDILSADKLKLTELKKLIVGNKLNLPNHQVLTHAQMGTSAIDSTVTRIWEVQKLSEYFEIKFIKEITEYNDEMQGFMATAKLGQQVNEEKAKKAVEKLNYFNKLISENIDTEIQKRQLSIDVLLK